MIYLLLFYEFFKIGLFCFGGAFAMIPLIGDAVFTHGWLTEKEFYDFIGICESTPGPIAVNMATYVGASQGGFLGSLAATAGVVLPSFLIILLIASVLRNFTKNRYFKGFLKGVKPVIIALILSTGATLLMKVVGYVDLETFAFDLNATTVFALLTAIFFFSKCILKKKISAILLIVLSAVLGLLVCMATSAMGIV